MSSFSLRELLKVGARRPFNGAVVHAVLRPDYTTASAACAPAETKGQDWSKLRLPAVFVFVHCVCD